MEELELVCFQIISFAGEARSAYMGAIQTAKQGNYEEAEKLIKEGGDAFLQAHKVHADLIHKEAAGEMEQTPNLLLIHAEDQLMAAETHKREEKDMKKVYLFCSAGMSTSMLAAKMQEVANSHQLDMEVAAFPHEQIGEIIAAKHPDCILLGPQVKYLYDQTVKEYGKTGIPIAVIDSGDYGMMNGEKVLKTAIKMMRAVGK